MRIAIRACWLLTLTLATPACGGGDDDSGPAGTGGAAGAGSGLAGGAGGVPVPCTEPLCEPTPPSTLLPAGSTTVELTVASDVPTRCAWAVGAEVPFEQMAPFDEGQDTTSHRTTLTGLDADTTVVNQVYVRCDAGDGYALTLQYRALPAPSPSFPRAGNLWGSWELMRNGGVAHCARIDLFLGAGFQPSEIAELRGLNPNVLVLDSINTVERSDGEDPIPEANFLHDTSGQRIEVWPGAWRLNLTRPEVATLQARYAYQKIVDSGFAFDGCFFDNFFTSQSWVTEDCWGNPVQVDADEDGVLDDPTWLDAAWRDGVFAELREWRRLMPYAYASGHLPRPPTAELGELFNGDSIGFLPADVREGEAGFARLWETYQGWWQVRSDPVITMVEASPPDSIAYGYDFTPLEKIPAATLEFARTFFPYMRFGLGVTLMNDGFFAYEFGDTWHGNDWWYDELDADLGAACGPAARVDLETPSTADLATNGGFESDLAGTWTLWASTDTGAAATAALDASQPGEGAQSVRIDITDPGDAVDWKVGFYQNDRSVTAGVSYDLRFWARADAAHTISVGLQKQVDDWRNYGLWRQVELGTQWVEHTVTFEANETATDGRLQFSVGTRVGTVWLDGVRLTEHPADVYRRDFQNGVAILNGTRSPQTVAVGSGLSRLVGAQAPRYQYVVDDADPTVTFTGTWVETGYDSGEWTAAAPYYHHWGTGCRELAGTTGDLSFPLALRADDTYDLDAWWPAAPAATGFTTQAVFEVVAGGTVIATATFDQTTGGDQWHRIGTVELAVADDARVRVRNQAAGTVVADAVLVQSAARYNDGTAAATVDLDPMDAIVLRRTTGSCP
jgi:hypothetical protein